MLYIMYTYSVSEYICIYIFTSPDLSQGLLLSLALFGAGLYSLTSYSLVYTLCSRSHARIRALITYVIYEKSLKIPISPATESLSSGQKITLIAVDANSIAMALTYESTIIPYMFVIIGSCILLHTILGISAIIGWIFCIFVMAPIQAYIGKLLTKVTKIYILQSDKRVKFIGELINGIKITKFYCWEIPLMDEVYKYRNKEMKQILKKIKYLSIMTMLNVATPQAMGLAMFGMYVLLGGTLTVSKVFSVLTLIHLIRNAVRLLPKGVMRATALYVSCKRLYVYCNSEELQHKAIEYNDPNSNTVVEANNCEFIWNKAKAYIDVSVMNKQERLKYENDKKEMEIKYSEMNNDIEHEIEFKLSNVSLKLEKNKLYALIGVVGSGLWYVISIYFNPLKRFYEI